MKKFKDKTAIVTGGASGIGRALCFNLARHGAFVTVADINIEGAKQVAESIASSGGRAGAVKLDVTKKEDVQKIIKDTAEEHGRLDYIFNNAGIGNIGDERDKTFDDWQRIIDINLLGVIYGTLAAYSLMVKQGSGHIVNTASIAGLMPSPTEVAYGTVKHAVVGLSTSLRVEGAALGVKVSAICPGIIQTSFFETSAFLNAKREEFMATLKLFTMKDVDKAAHIILRGVARNKALIIFPLYARCAWWLIRLNPLIMSTYLRFHMRLFRKVSRRTKT
jgi:NAD(P)-dependent dehydrogenase (short-subunit alcohol dehydrogenase family)